MLLKLKNKGFTLIELMVVIVIIGVLASLAIPRFTEASNKAKMGELPRIVASFESGYLATVAEGITINSAEDLIVKIPTTSNWFTYTVTNSGLTASLAKPIGKITTGNATSIYQATSEDFQRATTMNSGDLKKLIPNYVHTGMAGSGAN